MFDMATSVRTIPFGFFNFDVNIMPKVSGPPKCLVGNPWDRKK